MPRCRHSSSSLHDRIIRINTWAASLAAASIGLIILEQSYLPIQALCKHREMFYTLSRSMGWIHSVNRIVTDKLSPPLQWFSIVLLGDRLTKVLHNVMQIRSKHHLQIKSSTLSISLLDTDLARYLPTPDQTSLPLFWYAILMLARSLRNEHFLLSSRNIRVPNFRGLVWHFSWYFLHRIASITVHRVYETAGSNLPRAQQGGHANTNTFQGSSNS